MTDPTQKQDAGKGHLLGGVSKSLEKGVEEILTPFRAFVQNQVTASIILLLATVLAIALANSTYAEEYYAVLSTDLGLLFGDAVISWPVIHWVNDGLMSLFFFVIGLEIKREFMVGELSQPGKSLPVLAAAIGGMLVPSAIFLMINASTETWYGWGIPMATDTAFVIGVLAMLHRYIPSGLVVFITALAIIDDIGAILVIAVFYTEQLSMVYLGYALIVMIIMVLLNFMGIRRPAPYLVVGGVLWLVMLGSGIHATVAGILGAMCVPARPKHSPSWFVTRTRLLLKRFEAREREVEKGGTILSDQTQHEIVEQIHSVADKASTPLQRWEKALEHPIALLVLPIFALANAGVALNIETFSQLVFEPLVIGIVAGLVIGKCLGITLMTWLVLKFGLGTLARDVEIRHIIGVGLLAGIGFTMSVFVAGLAFDQSPQHINAAKTGILLASLVAGISGYLWLRLTARNLN